LSLQKKVDRENYQESDVRIWLLSDDLGSRDHFGNPIWTLFQQKGLSSDPGIEENAFVGAG